MSENLPQVRLNKFLAERLGVSRREADELIAANKILVNQKPAQLGAHIDKNNKVCYNGKIIPFKTEYFYLAFHKPVGYVCSRKAQGPAPTIYKLLPPEYQKLKTVGRLDKDSSGLILLTNDGDFSYRMTHPKFRKQKTYKVELDKPLQPLHQQMISDYGVMLDDGPSKFLVVKDDGDLAAGSVAGGGKLAGPAQNSHYVVILSEGRNRQIRRTFAALGYRVTKLHRTQFGPYLLGNKLKAGDYVIIKP